MILNSNVHTAFQKQSSQEVSSIIGSYHQGKNGFCNPKNVPYRIELLLHCDQSLISERKVKLWILKVWKGLFFKTNSGFRHFLVSLTKDLSTWLEPLRNYFCQEIQSMKLSKKNSLMERVSQFYENFLRAWHGTIFAPHHFSKTLVNSIWGVHNTTSQHPLCKYRKDFSAAWGGVSKNGCKKWPTYYSNSVSEPEFLWSLAFLLLASAYWGCYKRNMNKEWDLIFLLRV